MTPKFLLNVQIIIKTSWKMSLMLSLESLKMTSGAMLAEALPDFSTYVVYHINSTLSKLYLYVYYLISVQNQIYITMVRLTHVESWGPKTWSGDRKMQTFYKDKKKRVPYKVHYKVNINVQFIFRSFPYPILDLDQKHTNDLVT